MEFTKEKTNIAKDLAICLMLFNHLYAFPERLLHRNYYVPFIPFFDAELYVGRFGNICVSMFIFLSGYGMFLGYSRSNKSPICYSLEKLKDFYLIYWMYFLIFIPIGIIFFKNVTFWNSHEVRYSTEWFTIAENFVGWSAKYNGEWWFVRMFVLLLIFVSPLYLSLSKQKIGLLSFISPGIFVFYLLSKQDYSSPFSFTFWQISFATGIICAKFNFFSSRFIQYFEKLRGLWVLFGIVVCFELKLRFGAKIEFLLVPFFIYFVIRAVASLRLSNLFAYIGMYSFPIWLVHSFFCYYYFQDIIYYPRWSPLIFILLMSVSLLSAVSINYLQSRLALVKFKFRPTTND